MNPQLIGQERQSLDSLVSTLTASGGLPDCSACCPWGHENRERENPENCDVGASASHEFHRILPPLFVLLGPRHRACISGN
jgi:hypothetical protein